MTRIAVVEDDDVVGEAIVQTLARAGYEIERFTDGAAAAEAIAAKPPDLVMLDWMLPGLDGLEICRRLRVRHPRLPIVMLTSRGEEVERVLGLESGADDYIVKPFSTRELEARVKGLLRRSAPPSDEVPSSIEVGPFRLDRSSGELRGASRTVTLSPRETELMAILMERNGLVVTRDQLLERVWGQDFQGEAKTLDVHIRWVRIKVEENPSMPRHILTVRGRGYRFDAMGASSEEDAGAT
jgi:two-component system response regulator RegX3